MRMYVNKYVELLPSGPKILFLKEEKMPPT